jgi:SAM-dependent methyltransferase
MGEANQRSGRRRSALGWPIRRVLDPRVQWILNFIDERLGSSDTRAPVHVRLDAMEQRMDALLRGFGREFGQAIGPAADNPTLADVTVDLATFLNWAGGPDGVAAQGGLWFNPPVPLEYFPGRVDVLLVNERIVEQPFVFAEVAKAQGPPARVLDVGGGESTVGLSLASLGYDVVVCDPRGSRLTHPNIEVRAHPVEDLGPDAGPLDIVVALSMIEHIGLGFYADPAHRTEADADVRFLQHVRDLLRPGGRLILTVPYGPTATTDAFQRVYDEQRLDRLLAGWSDIEKQIVWRRDRLTWTPAAAAGGDAGVALISATR